MESDYHRPLARGERIGNYNVGADVMAAHRLVVGLDDGEIVEFGMELGSRDSCLENDELILV